MNWIKIFDKEIVKEENFVRSVTINNKKLCAVKYGDRIYITQAYCPHAGAGLSGGWCKDGKLVCPFHRYEYELETGRGAPGQGDYIDVYPVELRNDGVYVGFEQKKNLFKRFFGN